MEHAMSTPPPALVERMNDGGNPIGIAWRINYVANFYTGPVYKTVQARWGLSRPEFIVMFCLSRIPGLLARDIVTLCGRPKNSISRAVNAVMARRLVREEADGVGRARPLVLTETGRAMVEEIVPLFREREDSLLSTLSAEERRTLDALLRKLALRGDGWDAVY